MADRYYIGARYVPAVYEGPDGTNTWLPGVAYDGLVIVTYGTYSYMSKKPVPAGMDPPDINTEYWIKAAVYNADVNNVVEQLANKADKDGVYPDLFAGNLISDLMQTDNAPYLERETGGGLTNIAPLCYPTLVGASVAENQLCNGESVTVPNGRKYYLKKSGAESLGASTGTAITGLTSGSDMVIDLTQMLGSTIADYAYSLEQATAGSGIAWLRSYGFLKEYQAYNAGSIESVEVTEKKVVGFNQWDEETELGTINANGELIVSSSTIRSKNLTPVIPDTDYFMRVPTMIMNWSAGYDNNGELIGSLDIKSNRVFHTPTNCHFVKFSFLPVYGTTYKNDICFNLSSDRNGEYEPYKSTSYPLGSDVLRGLFKLDANNNLYADGDRKTADGIITRRYGTRAYQEGDESLSDAITDGTITVYKLLTPTTETSTPFASPQIVYPDGTEEFVTENGVPVGHETEYPYDLEGILEQLAEVPAAAGTYTLKATRSGANITYTWEQEV